MARPLRSRRFNTRMKGLFELEEAKEPQGNNLLIVDLLNLFFRYQRSNSYDFAADAMRTINSLAKSYECSKIVLTTDHRSSKFRKSIYPEYKSNRKDRYEKQTEEEKEKAAEFFKACDKALEVMKDLFFILRYEFVEADDLAAYIVSNFSDKFEHTWLISSDSDWDLLLSDKVSRFSLVTRKEYSLDNFYEEHSCDDPEQYLTQKILVGDPKDGINGIPGLGPSRAYKYIREYGSAIDLLGHLPIDSTLKTVKSINEVGPEVINRNCYLLDLLSFSEDAITFPGHNIEELKEELCQKLMN